MIIKQTGIRVKLVGQDGNIFNLASIAGISLKKHGKLNLAQEMYDRITHEAKDYDHALKIITEYVIAE